MAIVIMIVKSFAMLLVIDVDDDGLPDRSPSLGVDLASFVF